jgi:23S rRNA pseudouridine2605 synthase
MESSKSGVLTNKLEGQVSSTAAYPERRDRIAKILARAGLCSRRDAERWIKAGRVSVNNTVLISPAIIVSPKDLVTIDSWPLPEPQPTKLWRFHKPAGIITTRYDPKGRKTLFEILPPELPRLVSIGRLDLTSEGLLLLTNDGALARYLELPSQGWPRRYRVRVHGKVDLRQLSALGRGLTIGQTMYGPIQVVLDRHQGNTAWLNLSLREGKNREVRKVLKNLGLNVTRLIRIGFGPFQLGHLAPGMVEAVLTSVLYDQLPGFFAQKNADHQWPT